MSLAAAIRTAIRSGEPASVIADRLGCSLAEVLTIRLRLGTRRRKVAV